MYSIEVASQRVEKAIAGLPNETRARVLQAILELGNDPRPRGVKKLSGEMHGAWRVRVGDYRVIYDISDEQKLLVILAVLPRREAYDPR